MKKNNVGQTFLSVPPTVGQTLLAPSPLQATLSELRPTSRSVTFLFHLAAILFAFFLAPAIKAQPPPAADALLIVGAPGEPQYAEGFANAAAQWQALAKRSEAKLDVIGLDESDTPDRDRILDWIRDQPPDVSQPLWIMYLGHGTYSPAAGARLNLQGLDLSAAEIAAELEPFSRPLVFIDGGSASSPFINALSRPGRIIVTATQSPDEQNYARFGETFSEVVSDPASDIDRDGQTSILEAFLLASQRVETFYRESGRLPTELALIDDTGDGKGLSYQSFESLQLKPATAETFPAAGSLARRVSFAPSDQERQLSPAQIATRDALEAQLDALRARKTQMDERQYYYELELLLRQLSKIYRPDS